MNFQRTMPWLLNLLNHKYYMDKLNETVFCSWCASCWYKFIAPGDERLLMVWLMVALVDLVGRFSQLT